MCDDLTGSNATGALYSRLGLRAVSVGTLEPNRRLLRQVDVLLVNTGSRHWNPRRAYDAAYGVIEAIGDAALVVKRVDTTLRGNLGAELDAVVDALAARSSGQPLRVIAVPAFPDAGRTTIGGLQLVDGVPLSRTDVASDPFTPVRHSRVKTILAAQTARTITEIGLDVVEQGTAALVVALRECSSDVIVCDATDNEHLRLIAAAVAELSRAANARWVVLDSGPFGAELAAELGLHTHRVAPAHILAIVASQTERTRDQLAHAETTLRARWVDVDPANTDADEIFQRLRALAESAVRVIGVRVTSDDALQEHSSERAAAILRCLGDVAARAVAELRPAGLYASGGEAAATVTAALHADGFAIESQLLPLAVAGHLTGGPHDGLPFATKGGLIGGPDAATICLEHLWAAHIRHSIRHDRVGQSTDPARGRSHQREGDT